MRRENRFFYASVLLGLSHLMKQNNVPQFSYIYIGLVGGMFLLIALWKGDAR